MRAKITLAQRERSGRVGQCNGGTELLYPPASPFRTRGLGSTPQPQEGPCSPNTAVAPIPGLSPGPRSHPQLLIPIPVPAPIPIPTPISFPGPVPSLRPRPRTHPHPHPHPQFHALTPSPAPSPTPGPGPILRPQPQPQALTPSPAPDNPRL